ncbi:hypothetical protein CCAN11_2490051 [Capnocytophaga canimorsus]|uniref:Uncharacterized protein n=1 Tax=Capnocytophaga canimorsus TaxID=28188 RepID=A0A0B7ILG6_9FLAO|nr:hypothetical protein CCAN11_2490051 [Capnocytophaga canimorsus]
MTKAEIVSKISEKLGLDKADVQANGRKLYGGSKKLL